MSRGKETSPCAAALLLCAVLTLPAATGEADKIRSACAGLKCTRKVSLRKIEATCTMPADTHNLNGCSCRQLLNISQNVTSLDLSGNKLTEVPATSIFSCFVNLTALSLAENHIRDIQSETLAALEKLTFLNLSFNDLRDWKVSPTNELQGLKKLDVTGNEHWLPSEQLLQLRNLTTVEGVRLSQYCQDCSLCKMTSDDLNSSCSRYRWLSSPSDWRWHDEIPYGRALDFTKLGFWATCLADHVCRIDQDFLPYYTSLFDVTIKSSLALYATGSVALLVNIAVAVFIVLHKSLRNDLAVRLLLNVAVCDALIALVSILYSRFNSAQMYMKHFLDQLQGNDNGDDAFENKMKKLANIMGPILTCAVASHVFGSSISMLDKFFKIVFAMKPDVRLGRKTAVVLLVFSWSLSATLPVLPVFGIGGMTYTAWLGYTLLPTDIADIDRLKQRIGSAFGSQIALVILQLASFLLYVPIFIVAKKSGANVGVKREAAIARKIALLLCTNFIFFTIPVVVGVSQPEIWREVFLNYVFDNWRNHALAEIQWTAFLLQIFPILCLSINSLVNPFLYALRHPKLKQQLNPLLSRCWAATRECFGNLRQNIRRHTSIEEPINEVEMQEGRIPRVHLSPKEGTMMCKFNQFIPSAPLTPVN